VSQLATRRCRPPAKGATKLDRAQITRLEREVQDWVVDEERLTRRFEFVDFTAAMRFVDAMAGVAEAEQHHPDFTVHYRVVDVVIWTHTLGGLSENDFILAAKLDQIA